MTENIRQTILMAMGECRHVLTRAQATMPIQGPEYRAATKLVDQIDDAAEVLTGARDHFHLKGHSAP